MENTGSQLGAFVKAVAFAADKHRNQRRKRHIQLCVDSRHRRQIHRNRHLCRYRLILWFLRQNSFRRRRRRSYPRTHSHPNIYCRHILHSSNRRSICLSHHRTCACCSIDDEEATIKNPKNQTISLFLFLFLIHELLVDL